MADNVAITAGSGTTVAADEVVDGTLGTVKVQFVKLMDGTLDGTSKAAVGANGLAVDVKAAVITSGTITTVGAVTAISNALPAGTNAIGKLAANSGVDIGDVDVASIAAGDNNIGNVDIVTLPALPAGTNNIGDVDILSIAAGNNNIGDVDVASIAAGDNNIGNVDIVTLPALAAGTNNIGDVDVLTIPGIVGTIADDATTPGNPVMIGGKAVETDGTDPTSVSAEDDVAIVRTDRNRRMLVNTAHPNLWSANENHATAQTNNELKAAPGANLSLYITDIVISNGATAGTVLITEDTGGTPATKLGPYYLAANGGMSKRFATPIRITANKNVGFTSATVTTHTVSLSGYIAP